MGVRRYKTTSRCGETDCRQGGLLTDQPRDVLQDVARHCEVAGVPVIRLARDKSERVARQALVAIRRMKDLVLLSAFSYRRAVP